MKEVRRGFVRSLWVKKHYIWFSSTPCYPRTWSPTPSPWKAGAVALGCRWGLLQPNTKDAGSRRALTGITMTSLRVRTQHGQGLGLLLFRLSGFSHKLTQPLKVIPSPTEVGESFAMELTELRYYLTKVYVLQAKSILFFSKLKTSECILKGNYLCREKARKEKETLQFVSFRYLCKFVINL